MYAGIGSGRGTSTGENDELIAELKAQEYVYYRSTYLSAPAKRQDMRKTGIPFVITVTAMPTDEEDVPQVPVCPRCTACKAYLNPYSEVVPPGYKWRCSVCRSQNDTASPLHSYGACLRVFSPNENAANNRKVCTDPVLTRDVIEFASAIESTPAAFVYVFAVECTAESVEKGVLSSVLNMVERAIVCIDDPYDRAEMCIILYGDTGQIVRLDTEDLCMDTVNEVENVMPMLMDSAYVAPIKKIRSTLGRKIEEIKEAVEQREKEKKSNFGLALKVAQHILHRGGSLYVFMSSMPSVGSGEIKVSAGGVHMNTGSSGFYERISDELLAKSICVNLYVLASKPVEIPVLLVVVEKTGGDVRYYPAYLGTHSHDAVALERDVVQHLVHDTARNVYCRVRVSDGVSIKKYWGAYVQPDGLIKMAGMRKGKSFSFEIDYNDDLVLEGITVQIACIFTTAAGIRMVRVLNFVVPLGPAAVDPLGIVHAIALKAIDKETEQKGTGAQMVLRLATEAISYTGVQGTMGAFPRIIYGLIKNKIFKTASSDMRGIIMHGIRNHTMQVVDAMIYPTLVRMDAGEGDHTTLTNHLDHSDAQIVLPSPLKLSSSVISTDGAYYLDSGIIAYVFTGDASQYKGFEGVEGRITCPEGREHKGVQDLMEYLVRGRGVEPVLYSVHQSGHAFLLETFQGMLLEDGGSFASTSYQDFLRRFLSKGYASK